ncbi:unnamed protein product [Owenia fusiformis]|uniref:Uncharacterized protein n=1 Tax=Owenia fusiformis TaxID=6347 RepID=A0A8J1URX4_OWEFU|nr:unnamed protein product [Owenia fusiformis]
MEENKNQDNKNGFKMSRIEPRVSICICISLLFLCGFIFMTYQNQTFQNSFENLNENGQYFDLKPLMKPMNKEQSKTLIGLSVKQKKPVVNQEKSNKPQKHQNIATNEYLTKRPKYMEGDVPVGKVEKLPGVILIGIQKCGTAALKSYLRIHPSMISGKKHETHFFDRQINHNQPFEEEMKIYMEEFPKVLPNKTVFEKTPAYFDLADPYDLYRMNSTLKLILLVCDPVRRVISAYMHNKAHGRYAKDKSYEDYIFDKDGRVNTTAQVIIRSRYDKSLERYLKYFPINQFLIIDNKFLLNQPTLAMQDIEKFLGLNKFYTKETFYFNETIGFHCINPSIQPVNGGCMKGNKHRVHPNVSEENVLKLQQFFQPINDKFMKLAGTSMPSLKYFK